MKIILPVLVSLSLLFSMTVFADNHKKPGVPDNQKYSCGCSKSKQKSYSKS